MRTCSEMYRRHFVMSASAAASGVVGRRRCRLMGARSLARHYFYRAYSRSQMPRRRGKWKRPIDTRTFRNNARAKSTRATLVSSRSDGRRVFPSSFPTIAYLYLADTKMLARLKNFAYMGTCDRAAIGDKCNAST